jgi:hypothetical protein
VLTSTIGVSSPSISVHAYAKNVGVAARGLIAAVLAIKPIDEDSVPAHGECKPPASDELSLFRLYCLASRDSSYDSVSPELANELRLIAARG